MLTTFIVSQACLINVMVPNTSVKPVKKQKDLGIVHYTKFFCLRAKVTYMPQSHVPKPHCYSTIIPQKSLQFFKETDYTWMKIPLGTLKQPTWSEHCQK